MIIWIDGPYGSGKTSISAMLAQKYPDLKVVQTDELFNDWINRKENLGLAFCGDGTAQNNKLFLYWFKKYLMENIKDTIIVDMTIANLVCKEILYDSVDEYVMCHVVLEIDKDVMKERVTEQKRPDIEKAISTYDDYTKFLKENYEEAARIDVNNKTKQDIIREIELLFSERFVNEEGAYTKQ